jgi:hypothetical protein
MLYMLHLNMRSPSCRASTTTMNRLLAWISIACTLDLPDWSMSWFTCSLFTSNAGMLLRQLGPDTICQLWSTQHSSPWARTFLNDLYRLPLREIPDRDWCDMPTMWRWESMYVPMIGWISARCV